VKCGPGFCGEVPVRRLARPHDGGREGRAGRPARQYGPSPAANGRSRVDIVVVQALLGHATSGAISPEPVPRRRGLTTRTGIAHARDEESVPKLVAARFVDAGGEAGRLAHVGQRNSGHCQRVEYLSGTCSSASQMLVPHPVRAGEIIAECRRRCGLSWFAAGMPAVRARRLISRHTVGSPRRPPSRLRKTGPVARPAR